MMQTTRIYTIGTGHSMQRRNYVLAAHTKNRCGPLPFLQMRLSVQTVASDGVR